ncbi:MAG: 3-hydroxybutyryl-CoA dehydrogenase [Burkholderiaceae bacterium]|nr:3-hydroxybutyryl-CoA dehydrogenase [Burkholderiaceae bacterium]
MAIQTIGIIGAGTMGNGIAQACALSGLAAVMYDIAPAALERGMATVGRSLDRLIKKGTMSDADKATVLARISTTSELAGIAGADLVLEAATENEALKIKILGQVAALVPAQTIIATNTSSISITRLAEASGRPERFVGMHFFNPVPMMALVEIISGLRTSQETVAAVTAFAQQLGKTPIGVKNSAGFVVNRILCPMINEAVFALQEGLASAEEIDAGMKLGCNHPIGPLALCDLIGLDVELAVMEVLYNNFNDPKYRPAPLLRDMVDAGMLGRKTGRGFYSYQR